MITVRLQYIKQLLSTQAGSGLTPVGGVIVWPKDSDPSTSSNIWLECNGQTFDTDRFKKLYKVLGSNRVPNYQGMFLRGAGSQSYSQVNGDFFRIDNKEHTSYLGYNIATSTNHKSGSIGNIQGDSMRELNWSTFTAFSHTDDKTSYGELFGYDDHGLPVWLKNNNGYSGHASTQANPSADEGYVYLPLAPISIHVTETTSSGSGEHASTTTTSYDAEIPTKEINMFLTMDSWRASWSTPVDNEIRPVNVAVKYYIRAK